MRLSFPLISLVAELFSVIYFYNYTSFLDLYSKLCRSLPTPLPYACFPTPFHLHSHTLPPSNNLHFFFLLPTTSPHIMNRFSLTTAIPLSILLDRSNSPPLPLPPFRRLSVWPLSPSLAPCLLISFLLLLCALPVPSSLSSPSSSGPSWRERELVVGLESERGGGKEETGGVLLAVTVGVSWYDCSFVTRRQRDEYESDHR